MERFLKLFDCHSSYNTFSLNNNSTAPSISYCAEDGKIHYSSQEQSKEHKWIATYNDLSIETKECDSSNILKENEIDLTGLQSVRINNCVATIDEFAFDSCDTLTTINMPNTVTKILSCAFQYCDNLIDVILPNNLELIDEYAFQGCKSLNEIIIPNNVKKINAGAFKNCTKLSRIIFESPIPPILEENVFENTPCKIYVPCKALEAYRRAFWTYIRRIRCINYNKPIHRNRSGILAECDIFDKKIMLIQKCKCYDD